MPYMRHGNDVIMHNEQQLLTMVNETRIAVKENRDMLNTMVMAYNNLSATQDEVWNTLAVYMQAEVIEQGI